MLPFKKQTGHDTASINNVFIFMSSGQHEKRIFNFNEPQKEITMKKIMTSLIMILLVTSLNVYASPYQQLSVDRDTKTLCQYTYSQQNASGQKAYWDYCAYTVLVRAMYADSDWFKNEFSQKMEKFDGALAKKIGNEIAVSTARKYSTYLRTNYPAWEISYMNIKKNTTMIWDYMEEKEKMIKIFRETCIEVYEKYK